MSSPSETQNVPTGILGIPVYMIDKNNQIYILVGIVVMLLLCCCSSSSLLILSRGRRPMPMAFSMGSPQRPYE